MPKLKTYIWSNAFLEVRVESERMLGKSVLNVVDMARLLSLHRKSLREANLLYREPWFTGSRLQRIHSAAAGDVWRKT